MQAAKVSPLPPSPLRGGEVRMAGRSRPSRRSVGCGGVMLGMLGWWPGRQRRRLILLSPKAVFGGVGAVVLGAGLKAGMTGWGVGWVGLGEQQRAQQARRRGLLKGAGWDA